MQQAKPTLRLYKGKTEEASADWPVDAESPPTVEQVFRRYSPYVAAVAFRMLGRLQDLAEVLRSEIDRSVAESGQTDLDISSSR